MQRRALLGAGLAALAPACVGGGDAWDFRYRLKVAGFRAGDYVEGESVFRTRYRYIGDFKGQDLMPAAGWGRAVTLDFGDAGLLFGILDTIPDVEASHAFHPRGLRTLTSLSPEEYGGPEIDDGRAYGELAEDLGRREYSVPRDQWPLLVRFDDVRDPVTARLVQIPDQTYRFTSSVATQTVEQAFGDGAQIVAVTLALVDSRLPPSGGVKRDLPCADDLGPPDRERGMQRPLHELLRFHNFQLTGQAA